MNFGRTVVKPMNKFWQRFLTVLVVLLVIVGVSGLGSLGSANANMNSPEEVTNSIYSWWVQPLAVNDGRYTWIGSIASKGTVRLSRLDYQTGTQKTINIARIKADDHNGPAIAHSPNKNNLVIFYSQHASEKVVRYRFVNKEVMNISREYWLPFSDNTTYAQVIHHNDTLVIFTRVGSGKWNYRVSRDFGRSWEKERVFIDASGYGQMYSVVKPVNGDTGTNLVAFYGHPINSSYGKIDFATIRLGSGNVINGSGAVIGNIYKSSNGPAFRPGQLENAVTAQPNERIRLLDVGTVNDTPVVSYAKWNESADADATNGGQINSHYEIAMPNNTKKMGDGSWRWSYGNWRTINWDLRAGQKFGYHDRTQYIGGMVVGRNNQVYSSRYDISTQNWVIEEWYYNQSNDSFTFGREIGRSARPVVRPYVPQNAGNATVMVQDLINYSTYSNYNSTIKVF